MFEGHLHTTTEVCHLEHMAKTIQERGFTIGAELGVHHGGSAIYLARGIQASGGGTLWGVDSDAVGLEIARREIEKRQAEYYPNVNIELVVDFCPEAILSLPDGLQFAFVDDYHDGAHVAKELELLAPKMAEGGIIWGHDVRLDTLGIEEAFLKWGAKIYEEGFGLGEIVF